MKLLIGIPLLLSFVAFILSLLSLLGGYKQGFMEDYNLLTLNTSVLGQQAINQIIANGSSQIASALSQLGSGAATQLADTIGISQFYSIHTMNFCEGRFEPSVTVPGASHNVTACTAPLDFGAYNFTNRINQQLKIGSLSFTLADLGVSLDILKQLDMLPKFAKALAGVFIVGVLLAGLSMLGSALGLIVIPRKARTVSFFNWTLALLATIFLLASSLIATIGPREVTKQLQNQGAGGAGLGLITSTKLQGITWAAFAMMLLSMLYWFVELVAACVHRRRTAGYTENMGWSGK